MADLRITPTGNIINIALIMTVDFRNGMAYVNFINGHTAEIAIDSEWKKFFYEITKRGE